MKSIVESPVASFDDMHNKFQLDAPLSPIKGAPIQYLFEFQMSENISTEPDPDDLFDESEDLDMPGLMDIEPEDELELNSGRSDDEDNSSNDIHNIHTDGEDQSDQYPPSNDNNSHYSATDASQNDSGTRGLGKDSEKFLGKGREAPTILQATSALEDITNLLYPKRKKGAGYINPGFDTFKRSRMEGIKGFLALYMNTKSKTYNSWHASSYQIAITLSRGHYCAHQLQKLTWQFIGDRKILPINPYGSWNESMLVDEDLINDINLYLQELGSKITARKLVDFLAHEDVKSKHGITHTIRERIAQ